jgi:hypothetical protein
MTRQHLLAAIFASLLLTACEDQSDKPYVKIAGGGFMFNYRYSVLNYGFVAKPLRPLPEGSTLEASFEIPDSPQRLVLTLPVVAGKMQYGFETQALHGVKKNVPYKATLRLLEAGTGKQLAMMERDFRSDVEQSSLPTKAPVHGIGYFPAPQ